MKRKRVYIVAIFDPMNNAPKVLSNEGILAPGGKDIRSYRLGPRMGNWEYCGYRPYHRCGFISNRVEIRRKGISRLLIAGRSKAIKLREDLA